MDNYRILRVLGTGGMGTVYLVRHLPSGEIQALKKLHSHLTEPLDRARFAREFRLCQQLHHPLFLNVFTMQESEAATYYTMEFVEGETLDEFLKRLRQSMPWEGWLDRLQEIISSVLEGLEYLHQQGVIHRDLKPQNILITSQGETKLLDLGLAGQHQVSRITDKGTLVGTPHYMAPEMLQEMDLDVRSDLYSLGVLLYEALSGRLPFPQDDLMKLLQNVLLQPAPPLLSLGPLPADLSAWVMKLLSKDPEMRPLSAGLALQEWRSLFSTGASFNPEKELVLNLLAARLTGREKLLGQAFTLLGEKHRVVSLIGAGGLGKSRLLDGLEARLKGGGHKCHRLRPAGQRQTPFEPWARLLRQLVGRSLPPSLRDSGPALASLLPWLGPARGGDQMAMFSAVVRVLRHTMPSGWLVMDDLDRFNEEDLDLLRYLLSQPGQLPRSVCSADDRSWWSLGISGTTLAVEPLRPADLERLAAASLGGKPDAALTQCLQRESQGSPMVALEILKTLCGEKKLTRQAGVVSARELSGVSLQEVLQRRIAKLSPLQVELLFLIACARGRLTFADLYAATGESPHELLSALEPLLRFQMLSEPTPGSYTMVAHLQVFLEGHLPKDSLRGWHTQLALSLAQAGQSPERVAYHWLQAGAPERARQPLQDAAQLHLKGRNYSRALALLDQLQQIAAPLSATLQEQRADALFRLQQNAAARQIYEQLPDCREQPRLLRKIARCQWREGDLPASHLNTLRANQLQNVRLPSQSWGSKIWTMGSFVGLLLGLSRDTPAQSSPAARSDFEERAKNEMMLSRSLFFCRPKGWQGDFLYLMLRQGGYRGEADQHGLRAQKEIKLGTCYLLGPRPFFPRARHHLERGVDIALGLPSSLLRAELLLDAGYHLMTVGHAQIGQVAQTIYQQAQLLGDSALTIQSCHLLGLYHRLSGRLLHSQQAYAEASWIVAESSNAYERELIQTYLSILAALGGGPIDESTPSQVTGGVYLELQRQLARAYSAWRLGRPEEAVRLATASASEYRGDLLHAAERRLLRATCQPHHEIALRELEQSAVAIYPSFTCAALRLRAGQLSDPESRVPLRQALGLARRWDFPLEEGLIHAELALLDRDGVRYHRALDKLAEAGAQARLPENPPF